MKKIVIALLLVVLSASSVFALKPEDDAPMFSLRDGDGKEFSLGDVVGAKRKGKGKGVVLSFFASWCEPCRQELPVLNSLTDELNREGITVVIIGFKEDFDKIRTLLTDLNVRKPVVLSDRHGTAGDQYGVKFLPVTFFIGADGKVKHIIFGEIMNVNELRNGAEKLLR